MFESRAGWHSGSDFNLGFLIFAHPPSSQPASGCLSEYDMQQVGWKTLLCRNHMIKDTKTGVRVGLGSPRYK